MKQKSQSKMKAVGEKQHLRKRLSAASQSSSGSTPRPRSSLGRKDALLRPGIPDVQTKYKYIVTSVHVRRPAGGVVEILETVAQTPFRVLNFPVHRFQYLVSSIHVPNLPLPPPSCSLPPWQISRECQAIHAVAIVVVIRAKTVGARRKQCR